VLGNFNVKILILMTTKQSEQPEFEHELVEIGKVVNDNPNNNALKEIQNRLSAEAEFQKKEQDEEKAEKEAALAELEAMENETADKVCDDKKSDGASSDTESDSDAEDENHGRILNLKDPNVKSVVATKEKDEEWGEEGKDWEWEEEEGEKQEEKIV
jgi:hypothetical protein